MATPEGVVKRAVNKVLARYQTYKYMPVPTGYGKKTLDYLVCINGFFVAIETKAPGKKPTPLQAVTIHELEAAGAKVFVIDRVDGTTELEEYLTNASNCQPKAQGAGHPVRRERT